MAGAIVYLKRTKVNQCSRYLRTEHQTLPDSKKIIFFSKVFAELFSKSDRIPRIPRILSLSLLAFLKSDKTY